MITPFFGTASERCWRTTFPAPGSAKPGPPRRRSTKSGNGRGLSWCWTSACRAPAAWNSLLALNGRNPNLQFWSSACIPKTSTPCAPSKLAARLPGQTVKLPHESLSNREYQVVRMIASGQSLRQIAQQLSVSPQTISTHRARILEKLGLQTTAALIRYAVQNKLVE